MGKTKQERKDAREDRKKARQTAAKNAAETSSFLNTVVNDGIDIKFGDDKSPSYYKRLVNIIPQFGVDDFINDKTIWQKQLYNVAGETGWFYFKIFFDFNTNHGLLGKTLNTVYNKNQTNTLSSLENDVNSANNALNNAQKNADFANSLIQQASSVGDTWGLSSLMKSITQNAADSANASLETAKNNASAASKELYNFMFKGNTAIGYLFSISDKYIIENIPARIASLYKFSTTLRAIQTETPWVFKGINGLDTVNSTNFEELGKPREIEILFNNETADMRIGTLIDLYKHVCYDAMNQKQILPANLRKFDMYIMTYEVPLYNYDSELGCMGAGFAGFINGAKVESATTYPTQAGNFTNMMSFKLYSFKNCEIKCEGIGAYTPNQMSNETAQVMGNNTLKIAYDKVYESRMNEWGQFFLSDIGGYLYDEATGINNTNDIDSHAYRIDQIRENASIEYSRSAITDLYERLNDFGNIYTNQKQFSLF